MTVTAEPSPAAEPRLQEGGAKGEGREPREPGRLTAYAGRGKNMPAAVVTGTGAILREIQGGHPVWIDVERMTPEAVEEIRQIFPFHPLALEDVHHAVQRPKIEEYSNHLFVVAFAIAKIAGTEFEAQEVDILLGGNVLVTFHPGPVTPIETIADRLVRGRLAFDQGADMLLHAILDAIVDTCFPLIDAVDERIDEIETALVEGGDRKLLQDIFGVRKDILQLRRLVSPHREILSHLSTHEYPWISAPVRTYFRDVYDHLLRIGESLEIHRDVLTTAVDTYLGQAAENTNRTMKIFTAIATLGLPLTVITSFYGMNFDFLPGLHDPRAFGAMLLSMFGVEAALLMLFRKKGWL
ncbi:MAG: magnesium/cobalt transporter CorA [Candidatus Eisenbacteria bacterium]|nr:magnesium/cobalt transporter CorA [Candidatus Eisenbacteria bacterium]